ncbi:MAG: hypothetical protein M3Y84_07070 [Acidobacteriota bacterium]|nr:hypothetical protein [Acidobacteriota bacterium]
MPNALFYGEIVEKAETSAATSPFLASAAATAFQERVSHGIETCVFTSDTNYSAAVAEKNGAKRPQVSLA